jgi:hypothetical protein
MASYSEPPCLLASQFYRSLSPPLPCVEAGTGQRLGRFLSVIGIHNVEKECFIGVSDSLRGSAMMLVGLFRVLLVWFLRWVFPGLALRTLRLQWRRGSLELRDLDVPASLTRWLPVRLPLRFVRLHVGRLQVQLSWRALRQLAWWRTRNHTRLGDGTVRRASLNLISELLCIEVEDVGVMLTEDADERLDTPLERRTWQKLLQQLKMAKLRECERLAAHVLHLPLVLPSEQAFAQTRNAPVDGNQQPQTLQADNYEPETAQQSSCEASGSPETFSVMGSSSRNTDADEIVAADGFRTPAAESSLGPAHDLWSPSMSVPEDEQLPGKRLSESTQVSALEEKESPQKRARTMEQEVSTATARILSANRELDARTTGCHEGTASPRPSETLDSESSAVSGVSAESFEEARDELFETYTDTNAEDLDAPSGTTRSRHESESSISAGQLEWDSSVFLEIFERSAWIQCFRQIRVRLHRVWLRIESNPEQCRNKFGNVAVSPWSFELSLEDALFEPPDAAFEAQVRERCSLAVPNPSSETDARHEDSSLYLWRGCCLRGLRLRIVADDERWLPLLAKSSANDGRTSITPLHMADWDWFWQRLRHRAWRSYLVTDLALVARIGINMSALEDTSLRLTEEIEANNRVPVDSTTLRLYGSIARVDGNLTLTSLVGLTRLADQLARWSWRMRLRYLYHVPDERPCAAFGSRLRRSSGNRAARAWWRYATRCLLGMRRQKQAAYSVPVALPQLSQWLRLQLLYFALYREQVYRVRAPAHLFDHFWPAIVSGWQSRLLPDRGLSRKAWAVDSAPRWSGDAPKTLAAQLRFLEEHMPLEQLLNARVLVHVQQRMKRQHPLRSSVWSWLGSWKRFLNKARQIPRQWIGLASRGLWGNRQPIESIRQQQEPCTEVPSGENAYPSDAPPYHDDAMDSNDDCESTGGNREQEDALRQLRQCFQQSWMEAFADQRAGSMFFTDSLVEALETSVPLDVNIQLTEATWKLWRQPVIDPTERAADTLRFPHTEMTGCETSALIGLHLEALSIRIQDVGTTIPLRVEMLLGDFQILPEMIQVQARPQSPFYATMPVADPSVALCLLLTIQKQVDRGTSQQSGPAALQVGASTDANQETKPGEPKTPASSLYLRLQPLQVRIQPRQMMAIAELASQWQASIPPFLAKGIDGLAQEDSRAVRVRAQEALRLHQRFTIDVYCEWIQVWLSNRWLIYVERLSLIRTPRAPEPLSVGAAVPRTPLTLSFASVQAQFRPCLAASTSFSNTLPTSLTVETRLLSDSASLVQLLEPVPLVVELYGQLNETHQRSDVLEPSMHLVLSIRVPLTLHFPLGVVLELQQELEQNVRHWHESVAADNRCATRLWCAPPTSELFANAASLLLTCELVFAQPLLWMNGSRRRGLYTDCSNLRVLVLSVFGALHLLDAQTDMPPDTQDEFLPPTWQLMDSRGSDGHWSFSVPRDVDLVLWRPISDQFEHREPDLMLQQAEPAGARLQMVTDSITAWGLTLSSREQATRFYQLWCSLHTESERFGWWHFLHPRFKPWCDTDVAAIRNSQKSGVRDRCWYTSSADQRCSNDAVDDARLGTRPLSIEKTRSPMALWILVDIPHGLAIDLPVAGSTQHEYAVSNPYVAADRKLVDSERPAAASDPNCCFQVAISRLQLQLRTACTSLPVDSALLRIGGVDVRMQSGLDSLHQSRTSLPIVQIPGANAVPSNHGLVSRRFTVCWQQYIHKGGLADVDEASHPNPVELVIAFRCALVEDDPVQCLVIIPSVSVLGHEAWMQTFRTYLFQILEARTQRHRPDLAPCRNAGSLHTERRQGAIAASTEQAQQSGRTSAVSSAWTRVRRKLRSWRIATHFWVMLLQSAAWDSHARAEHDVNCSNAADEHHGSRESIWWRWWPSLQHRSIRTRTDAPSHRVAEAVPIIHDETSSSRVTQRQIAQRVYFSCLIHLNEALISMRATQEEFGVFAELAVSNLDLECSSDGQEALELCMEMEQLVLRDLLALRPDMHGTVRFRCGPSPKAESIIASVTPSSEISRTIGNSVGELFATSCESNVDQQADAGCNEVRDRMPIVREASANPSLSLKGRLGSTPWESLVGGTSAESRAKSDPSKSVASRSGTVPIALQMMVTAPEINYFHPFYALLVETIYVWQARLGVAESMPCMQDSTDRGETPEEHQLDPTGHRSNGAKAALTCAAPSITPADTIRLEICCQEPLLIFPSELDEEPLVLVKLDTARLALEQVPKLYSSGSSASVPRWSFSGRAESSFEAQVEQVGVYCFAQDLERTLLTFLEPVPMLEASIHWIQASTEESVADTVDASGLSRESSDIEVLLAQELQPDAASDASREANKFHVALHAHAAELECHLSPSVAAALEMLLLTNLLRTYGVQRFPVSSQQRLQWAVELSFDRCLMFADADDAELALEKDLSESLSTSKDTTVRDDGRFSTQPRDHVLIAHQAVSSVSTASPSASASQAMVPRGQQQETAPLESFHPEGRARTRQRTTSDPGQRPYTAASDASLDAASAKARPRHPSGASPFRGRHAHSQANLLQPRKTSSSMLDSEEEATEVSTQVLLDCRSFRGIFLMLLPRGETEAHFTLTEFQLWSQRDQAERNTDVKECQPARSTAAAKAHLKRPPRPAAASGPAPEQMFALPSSLAIEAGSVSGPASKSRWRQMRSGLVLSTGPLSLDMEAQPGQPLHFQFEVKEPMQLVLCGASAVAVLDVFTQIVVVLGEMTASLRPYLQMHAISIESLFATKGWDWGLHLPSAELLLLDEKTFGATMRAGIGLQVEFHLSIRQAADGCLQRLVASVEDLMFFRVWMQRQAAPHRWYWRGCMLHDLQNAPYFGSILINRTCPGEKSLTDTPEDMPTIQLVSEELRLRLGIDDLVLCLRALDALLNALFRRMQLGQVRRAWQSHRLRPRSEAIHQRSNRFDRDSVENEPRRGQYFWQSHRYSGGSRPSGVGLRTSTTSLEQERQNLLRGETSRRLDRLRSWFRSKLGYAPQASDSFEQATQHGHERSARMTESVWESSALMDGLASPERRSSAGSDAAGSVADQEAAAVSEDLQRAPASIATDTAVTRVWTLSWQGSIAPIQFSLLNSFAEVPHALVSLALSVEYLDITLEPDIGALGIALHIRVGMQTFALDRFVWETLAEPFAFWVHIRSQIGHPVDALTLGVAMEVLESIEFTISDSFIHSITQLDQRIRQDFAIEKRQVGIQRQPHYRQRAWIRWTSPRSEPTTLRIHNATEFVLCLETQLQLMPLQIAAGASVELSILAPLPSTCCWYPESDQQHPEAAFRARLSITDDSFESTPWAPVWLNLSRYGRQVLHLRSTETSGTSAMKERANTSTWLQTLNLLMISGLRGDHLEISFHSPLILRNCTGEKLWLQLEISSPASTSTTGESSISPVWYWMRLVSAFATSSLRKRRLTSSHRSTDRPAGTEAWQRPTRKDADNLAKVLLLETWLANDASLSLPVGWLALNGLLRLAGVQSIGTSHAASASSTTRAEARPERPDDELDIAASMLADTAAAPMDADSAVLLTASHVEDMKTTATMTRTNVPLMSAAQSAEGALRPRSSFFASVRAFQTLSERCFLEMTITPVVKLLNALPYAAHLALKQDGKLAAELELASGQEASTPHVDWMRPWQMDWSVLRPDDVYRCHKPDPFPSLVLNTFAEERNDQTWYLNLLFVGQRTQAQRWWRLQFVRQEISDDPGARWLITLTAHYWILNFTDLPLMAMPLNPIPRGDDRRPWYRFWGNPDTANRQAPFPKAATANEPCLAHHLGQGEHRGSPGSEVVVTPSDLTASVAQSELGTDAFHQSGIHRRPANVSETALASVISLASSEPEPTMATRVRLFVSNGTDNDDDAYWPQEHFRSLPQRKKSIQVRYQTMGKTSLILDQWPLVIHRQPHWGLSGVTLVSLHPFVLIHNASTYRMAFRGLASRAADAMVMDAGAEAPERTRVQPLRLPERVRSVRARRWLAHPALSIAIASEDHWFWSSAFPLEEDRAFTLSIIVPELTRTEHLGSQRVKLLLRSASSSIQKWWCLRNRSNCNASPRSKAMHSALGSSRMDRKSTSEQADPQLRVRDRHSNPNLIDAYECILRVQVSSNVWGQKIVTLTDELPTSPRFALLNRTPFVIVYRWVSTATTWLGVNRGMFLVASPRSRRLLSPGFVGVSRIQAMAFASIEQALDWRHWRHGQEYDLMEPLVYDALPVDGEASQTGSCIYAQVDFVGTRTTQLVFSMRPSAAVASATLERHRRDQLGTFLSNDSQLLPLEILLQVRVHRLAASLVLRNAQMEFFEMLYGAASGVELFLHTYGFESALSLNIESVQCDNALPFYVSPVVMISNHEPWISCAARWRQHAGGRHYYSISLRVAELLIMLDDGLLWRFLVAAREFWSGLSQRRAGQRQTAPFLRNILVANDAPALWSESSRAVVQNRLEHSYFHHVRVERLRMRLSFKSDRERASETTARTRQSLYTAGLVLTELDSALVLVSAFNMRQVYAPLNEIIERMIQHVLWQSFLSSYNFIGGLSWLGDPAGWLHELREGTFDFFNEPISGLFESNEALWRGFRRGAFAQGQAITFALTQPIAQMAGSMARGLGTISLNRTFEVARSRQDRTLGEPEDMFLGTAYGLLGTGTALGAALTGIFIEPVRGYRQRGTRGFLQGLVAGIWGWVPLLLTSFLVLIQKVATGIRNQNRVDLRTRERMRDPRVLYGTSYAPIPPYVAYLARGQRLLHHVQRGALASESYLMHIEFDLGELEVHVPSSTPWRRLAPRLMAWTSSIEQPMSCLIRQDPRNAILTVPIPAAVILSRAMLVAVDGNGAFLWRCRLSRIERIQERRDQDGAHWFWVLSRRRRRRLGHGQGAAEAMAWVALPTRPPSPSVNAFLKLVQLAVRRQTSIERRPAPETETFSRRLPAATSELNAGQFVDAQARAARMV